jgi:DNA-binding response OmpR family regulator
MGTSLEFILVEENEDDVLFLQRAWKACDIPHSLRVAPGGKSAIGYLEEWTRSRERGDASATPVIMVDDKMSSMGGVKTLRTIRGREEWSHLPVIMLMASADNHRELKSYRNGANGYFVKPMDFDDLVALVRAVVRYWELAELPD